MKKLVTICSIFGLTASVNTLAASLDVDINNDTLRGQYNFSAANAALGVSAALILTDDKGEVGYFTAHTQGRLRNQQFVKGGFGDVTIPSFTDLTVSAEVWLHRHSIATEVRSAILLTLIRLISIR